MDYRYWDSNAFLGWLCKEPDKVPFCRPVLDAAAAGRVMLVTSALTIAEVLVMRKNVKIPRTRAKEVEAFFRHAWIVVRDVDRFVAEDARALVWDNGVDPKDAIHVATALRQDVEIDQFDTFDNQLIKLSGKLGNPPMTIGVPSLPPKLPFELDEHDDAPDEDES